MKIFLSIFSELNYVVEINDGQTKDSPTSNETLTCNCIIDQYSDMVNSSICDDEVKKAFLNRIKVERHVGKIRSSME